VCFLEGRGLPSTLRVYLDYALDHGYTVYFVYPDSPWWVETVAPFLRNKKVNDVTTAAKAVEIAQMLFRKNIHGVPETTLADMLLRFQWVTREEYAEATFQRVLALEKELADMRLRLARLDKISL
jgi:hypothetical protein